MPNMDLGFKHLPNCSTLLKHQQLRTSGGWVVSMNQNQSKAAFFRFLQLCCMLLSKAGLPLKKLFGPSSSVSIAFRARRQGQGEFADDPAERDPKLVALGEQKPPVLPRCTGRDCIFSVKIPSNSTACTGIQRCTSETPNPLSAMAAWQCSGTWPASLPMHW